MITDLKGAKFSSKSKLFLLIGSVLVLFSVGLFLTLKFNGKVNDLISPTDLSALISLILTIVSGVFGGQLATSINYPPMLGMLMAGMFVRNAFPLLIVDIPHSWTSILWTFSLAAVVARAGLSLELEILRKNAKAVFLLGTIPILFEAYWLANVSSWIFHLPKAWAHLLAFGVASISPGVVVPLILNLNEKSEWSGSRLPPLMIASVSIDVLVATVSFGISLNYAFKNQELDPSWHSSFLFVALQELTLGLMVGAVFGSFAFLLTFIKSYKIISFSSMFLLSALTMGWDSSHTATGIACFSIIISWATAANTWTKADISAADKKLKILWDFFKLFLFPLIGASVSFTNLPIHIFLQCLTLVFSSVIVKFLAAFVTSYVSDMEFEECIFISGIWTGKASVQAALCRAALEVVHTRNLTGKEEENYAKLVFMSMLSAILIGGPAAGVWFSYFSKKPVGLAIEPRDHV